jgi:NTE family protein
MILQRTKVVSLALQGGGSHGAFTWGVLDRLLEEPRLEIEGISGASAGAMNAVMVAAGLAQGGAEGARAMLANFWQRIGEQSRLTLFQPSLLDLLDGRQGLDWSPGYQLSRVMGRVLSPYQTNPLDRNPLRDIISGLVDFEGLRRACPVKLFIATTQVKTGKLRVFAAEETSAEVLLASACLPSIHHAVTIEGEPYWDGGYTGNPPIFPLLYGCDHPDILAVLLSPLVRPEIPSSVEAIREREVELAFSTTFLREMRAIAQAQKQLGWFAVGRLERRLKRLNFHLVHGEDLLGGLRHSSKVNTRTEFLTMLRDEGRAHADRWLEQHFESIGTRSSVNLAELFG